ncbi:MarR family winged helix-turn-helix transcriptional regulator [Streptomyces sp. NPDC088354]|uniref:MarR family winged helix-turn-helix transcriptional regulator n=1 Tax=unclassified Streptomyces TaxID=2593676 RepID=UPI0029B0AFBB|nr:MarR family winged helix-turn-helix transcriptional regulator [Streptomyces sp. MI02-7b]MDX3072597.1 MarR family winged helix-turn-helix transcriptional regulator [Streptomyces sp. MI02-7b]
MSQVTPPPASPPRGQQPLTPDEEALVRSLARVIYALPRALDTDLVREQRMPLIEYLTLMHLSEAPGRQLRMSDLAGVCELSLSGMTRVVQRLEKQGIVQRIRSEQDARGWNAVLTDSGFTRLTEAWPTNLASVRRHFLDHLDGLDIKVLAAALENVAT